MLQKFLNWLVGLFNPSYNTYSLPEHNAVVDNRQRIMKESLDTISKIKNIKREYFDAESELDTVIHDILSVYKTFEENPSINITNLEIFTNHILKQGILEYLDAIVENHLLEETKKKVKVVEFDTIESEPDVPVKKLNVGEFVSEQTYKNLVSIISSVIYDSNIYQSVEIWYSRNNNHKLIWQSDYVKMVYNMMKTDMDKRKFIELLHKNFYEPDIIEDLKKEIRNADIRNSIKIK